MDGLGGNFGGIGRNVGHVDVKVVDQVGVADGDGVRQTAEGDTRGDATAGNRLKIGGLREFRNVRDVGFFRSCGNDRSSERVFGIAFGGGDNRQQIIGTPMPHAQRQHIGKGGFAGGDRAGLIQYDGIDFAACFQRFGGTDQHPHASRAASRDRHRQRSRQSERARAGDQQHRHRGNQRVRDTRFGAEREPQRARPYGDEHHDRHEYAGNAVRQSLYGSLRALRGTHHADDLREHGVLADFRGAVPQRATTVDGDARHFAALGFGDRHGFAGDHRFVHGGAAGYDDAVDRQLLAGADGDDVADAHVIDGDAGFLAVSHHAGGFRLQTRQCAHGFTGAFAGARFEQLADKHKRDDHTDRFEIRFARVLGQDARREGDHAGVGECGQRAEADERVHLRRAVGDRGETAAENRQCRIADDWQHQQELQPVRHRIQHEHGGAEYRNRADGRHDKTGDEGANSRFRSARFARITRTGRLDGAFLRALHACFRGTGCVGTVSSRANVRIAGIGHTGADGTNRGTGGGTDTCMLSRQYAQRAVQHVHTACEGILARLVGMKRQRGRAEGGQRKIDPEIGEHDMRRAFAVFLAIEDQPQRHARFGFDDGWVIPAFDFDDRFLHAVAQRRTICFARCEEEPQHARRDEQRHNKRDCDVHIPAAFRP